MLECECTRLQSNHQFLSSCPALQYEHRVHSIWLIIWNFFLDYFHIFQLIHSVFVWLLHCDEPEQSTAVSGAAANATYSILETTGSEFAEALLRKKQRSEFWGWWTTRITPYHSDPCRYDGSLSLLFLTFFLFLFAALKRSFEVEEVESPTNPSQVSRRNVNSLRSSATSRFHELGSRNSENSSRHGSESSSSGQRSPKSGGRRIELSRRAELSIDISSKQVDSLSSPGINRFGLRRPEVSLSNRISEPGSPRRAEITISRAQEPITAYRRADVPSAAKISEPVQRKVETPSTAESLSSLGRRIVPLVNRQGETSSPSTESENSFPLEANMTTSLTEYKNASEASENSSRTTDSE